MTTRSRANQQPINIQSIFSNQYPINISNQNLNQYAINILHEKILIKILIVKSTCKINIWEDQNMDCNHYAMLRVVWAGPKFLTLPSVDRREIVKAHKKSWTSVKCLLKQQGARSTVLDGVQDFPCSVCSSQSPPKHSRPRTIKESLDFNDRIAIDGLKFTNSQGQQFHLYHIIDLDTNFHVAGHDSTE